MTERTLLNRLAQGENEATEFISKVSSSDSIGKTICAFLNASGGTIFCGVDPQGNVIGVDVDDEGICSSLEGKFQSRISPTSLFTATIVDIVGKSILVIEVPAGKDQPYLYKGAIYIRHGEHSKPATSSTLRKLVQRQLDEPERWERRLSPLLIEDMLDRGEVSEVVRVASRQERHVFREPDDIRSVMGELSLWRPEGYSQGADVLFSTKPSQRHPQCRVQFVQFDSDKVGSDYVDLRWFEGPLVKVAFQLIEVLGALNRSSAQFTDSSFERQNRSSYSMMALREALVNALVHRDYTSYSGGVKISVYPSHIEFWNSGNLPKNLSVSDLKKDHPSIPTNPDIAYVFFLRDWMERTGRGTLKIIQACKDLGTPLPRWTNTSGGVTLTLFAALPSRAVSFEMNDRQRLYLEKAKVGEMISPAEYRERFAQDVVERTARRDLNQLEEFGFVRRHGSGPSTVYTRLET